MSIPKRPWTVEEYPNLESTHKKFYVGDRALCDADGSPIDLNSETLEAIAKAMNAEMDKTILFQLSASDFSDVAKERGINNLTNEELLFLKKTFGNSINWNEWVDAALDEMETYMPGKKEAHAKI